MNAKKCSICGQLYTGHGHNASPINDGRCCDECNTTKVIPARLEIVLNTIKDGGQKKKD